MRIMYVSFIRGAGAGGPPSRLKDVTASAAQITVCTPPGRKVTVTGRLGTVTETETASRKWMIN